MKNDNDTLKALYKTLKTTQKRLYDIENAGREPIAVIGMACRFPGGADTIAAYRALLESGGDGVCEVPPERWDGSMYYDPDPEVPGKVTTNRAGFLKEPIDGFDCAFFHLSPKEVQSIDPQQRLLLEVCWEAFENAGLDITTLKGSKTGVFCGIANSDYAAAHLRSGDPEKIDAYSVTGTALSAAVGRISYLFGFEGPNMALDTACSSSLVAVHLACRSLRSGESDLAVAAGINLILTPEGHIGFSKIRALSPDGRCKSFDDGADGYGRGEGCGLIVLKRLSDARKDNDPVRAVIRGSAVNQDGRTNGFTAPSSLSQEKVLRKALADSTLDPEDIGYIEAHGTGTSLGDPIEMESIGKVYSPGRDMARPLYVGSVKANIGHLEAAAGIAGLIKAVLMLDGARIFPQIHFSKPSRHIPWDRLAVKIPLESMPWHRNKAPLAAGVSSFGFSGTNAHVILQAADSPLLDEQAPDQSHHILNISANDREGLGDMMARYHGFLADTDSRIGDICHTASVGRTHFPHRLSVVGRTKEELREALEACINGKTPENASFSDGPEKSDKRIVFLFTGQGSQYPKMGWDLYASQPVFRDEMERCDALLRPHMARSLISLIHEGDISSLHETRHTQPVIFAVEYALAKLLESWGIKPSLVVGHSIGEYVAATLAGVFELEDVLGLVAARGSLVQSLPMNGRMAVIVTGQTRVAEAIASCREKVSIAAVNAPRNTVISGEKEAVEGLCARFRKEGVASHILNVSHAFHSCLLDPVIDAFGTLAAKIRYAPPKLPIMANVTGKPGGAEMAASDYWTTHLREPVRFYDSMRAIGEAGYKIFLEVGATSTLTSLGRQCLPAHGGIWLSTLGSRDVSANLRRTGHIEGRSDWEPLLCSLAGLYTAGCDIDWEGFDHPYQRKRVVLPNYPFQRTRCWLELPGPRKKLPAPAVPSDSAEAIASMQAAPPLPPILQSMRPTRPHRPSRFERIQSEVRRLMYQSAEIEIAGNDGDTNLFELGFASLMIARLKDLIKRTYGLDVQMSWFYSKLDTFNKTVDFIDRESGADDEPVQADAPLFTMPRAARVEGDADGIISQQMELMRRQLAVMSEQLLVLRGPLAGKSGPQELLDRQTSLLRDPRTEDREQRTENSVSLSSVIRDPVIVNGAKKCDAYVAYRGVTAREKLELNTRQQAHLKKLIDRYTGLTAGSKERTGKFRQVFANTRNIAGFRPEWKEMIYQIIVDRAEGSHFTDIDGKDYLDISMGFGVYLFGHNPPFVQAALQQELRQGTPIGPMSDRAGKVATLIHELTGVERVAFFNTGTEAVMAAVRIARTVTGRKKIVLFSSSYHGHFDGVLAVKDYDGPAGRAVPMSPGTLPEMVRDVFVLDYGTDAALQFIEAHGREIAAVLVEPVQSRRPDLQPKVFLKQLREITTVSKSALIFDEMIIGFRVHPGGGQAWFDIRADIVTYGKVVGGGIPIGVVAGKAHYLDAVDGGMWNYGDGSFPEKENTFIAGTFNHHPLAMAGAHAVLEHLKGSGPQLQENLNRRTGELAQRLNTWFAAEDLPIRMSHFGSLFRIPLKGDQELLYYHLLSRGIYIWEGRNCFLSTAHTDQDIDYLVNAVKESIGEMRAGGLFEGGLVPLSVIRSPLKPTDISFDTANGQQSTVNGFYPLSSAQMRMFILSQMAGGEVGYHIPLALFIEGPLDAAKVETIFQELLQEHEILRTGFEMADGKVVQKVHSHVNFSVMHRQIPENAVEETIRDFIRPFDLSKPPLLRVCIARINDGRHLFVLDTHHIVFDGISGNILMGEFIRRYSGEAPSGPAAQYRDYVAAEQDYFAGGDYPKHEAYWLEKFRTPAPLLFLPTDFARPPVKAFRGDKIFRKVDREAVLAVRRFARSAGTSLHMTLFAAYFLLLYKLTGNEDVVVGATYDGRSGEKFTDSVGMFVDTLPVRCRPEGKKTFGAFLDEVKMAVLEAHDCQRYPFEHLVEKLALPREPSRNPLFDTMFVYETQASASVVSVGLTFTEKQCGTGSATFDMILDIADSGQELSLSLEYGTDLFRRDTVERFLNYYEHILKKISDLAGKSLADIDMIPGDEKRLLLEAFNATLADYPREKTLVALFEEQVEKIPQAVAVICDGRELTYRDLNARANSLAHHLRDVHGIVADDRVGLMLDRSQWMIIGILGILKAGGAYVPLDPAYPEARIRFMIEDSGCKAVVAEESYQDILRGMSNTVDLMDVSDTPAGSMENPTRINRPHHLAYVIYTSGSTGVPKGVLIEHRNVVRLMTNDKFQFDFTENDVWTMFHSYCFDFSVWEMYGALLYGGKLVIVPKETSRDSGKFLALLKSEKVTVLNQTPRSFYNLAELETAVPGCNLSLRYVIFGGEALKPSMLKAFREKYPGVKLVNMYGITETTVHVTYKEITGPEIDANVNNVGRPIPTLTAYIMDKELRLLPIGVPGELLVGGDGVGRGYLNRDALTREKFIANPHKEGERLYRSGDLARMLPGGEIEYLGRIDQQVKIRGYRIELGEIENVLLGHPGIDQAAVIDREDERGDRFLCAYLVTGEDNQIDDGRLMTDESPASDIRQPLEIEALRSYLGAKLPDYMIPSRFFRIGKMPLTSNGKIDTKALLAIEGAGLKHDTGFAGPETDQEAILAGIWKAVLGREEIGVLDNFFALGGDSIKAIQILSRLSRQHLKLEVGHIFETPTIRALGKKLSTISRIPEQGMITDRVSLTAIQSWFFNEHAGEWDHYAQAVWIRSKERVDEKALWLSLQKLQAHHDCLRMISRVEGESVVQEIAGPKYPLGFTIVDLKGKKDAGLELDRISAEVPASIRLEVGPMMKTVLFRLDEGDRILIVLHHLVVDGVSWRILIEDLGVCYGQVISGRSLDLPQKTDSFRLWAEKTAEYGESPKLLEEMPFWQKIEEAGALAIPADLVLSTNRYEDAGTVFVELDESRTLALTTKANRAYHTEVTDLLLAALARAMKRCYGAGRGFIDMEGHGREPLFDDIDIGRTVGWFTSIYPALIDIPESDVPGLQIKQIKEGLRRIPNKGIGYGILKYLSPAAKKGHVRFSRKSRILFNYLGSFDAGAQDGFDIDERNAANTIGGAFERESEIVIEGAVIGKKLKLSLNYNAKLHARETVEPFLQALRDELLAVIDHCTGRKTEELTPHDLTWKGFTLRELDAVLSGCGISNANLKDIYPLSPLQEGMLYHARLEAGAGSESVPTAAYFMQISFGIDGPLDPAVFEACWNRLVARHDILRTVFTHKGADRPLQIVARQAAIDFRFEDIRALSEDGQSEFLAAFRDRDRKEGFDLMVKVPMRVSVFKKTEQSFEVVWSYHHLLIDGWCAGILMSEFFEAYGILRQGGATAVIPAAPYGDYIRWVEHLDRQATIDYWRDYLQGYDHPAVLPKGTWGEEGFRQETSILEIGPQTVEGVKRFAAGNRVTVNTVVQTAWALVLGRYCGSDDVVFGATVSGRPAQVAGIENMAGLFINTVPVRIRIDPEKTMARLVRDVQADALQSQSHHYGSLADIQAVTSLKQDLLDHVLVFENYPLADELIGLEQKYPLGFAIRDVKVFEQTSYDLALVVEPGRTVRVEFRYNASVFSGDLMEQVKEAFGAVIASVAGGAEMTIGELRRSLMSTAEKNERDAFIASAREISEDF